MKLLKSDNNYKGEWIKLVVASPKIGTGVTLRHFETAIIEEVHWTNGEKEQIIGRMVRHGSHEHSSDPDCNKVVNVYVLCSRICPGDIEKTLDVISLKRFETWKHDNEATLKARYSLRV